MTRRQGDLTAGEWAVLALTTEGETHGFEIARQLAPDGEVGRIWAVPRPLVYRALDTLQDLGLVEKTGTTASPRGPARTIVQATVDGRRALRRWLDEPAQHVRDVRTLTLLKLLFLHRAGEDPATLVAAQRQVVMRLRTALPDPGGLTGFDHTLASWRVEMASAALRFLDRLEG